MLRNEELAQRLGRMLQRDARVLAVFLGGSLAAGDADAWSDIDLLLATEHRDSVAALCQGYLQQCAELLYFRRVPGPVCLYHGITAEGDRCDLYLLLPSQIKTLSRASLRVIWDRARITESLAGRAAGGDPVDLSALAGEFLRVLGLLPALVGRREYLLGVSGAQQLRGYLTTLLLERDGIAGRGSTLRLNPYLSAASRRVLDDIPIPEPTEQSIAEAYAACTREFLPSARALAADRGVPWPDRFAAVTLERLATELGLELP